MAHRGGAALAPENTMEAFRQAVEAWHSDVLELDVRPTLDGEIVVFHDETLDRTTNGSGPVVDCSLEELRELDAAYHFSPDGEDGYPLRGRGVRIPTLREVLRTFPTVRVNIEIKDPRAQGEVGEVVREEGAERRVLIAAGSLQARELLNKSGLPVSASGRQLWLTHLAQAVRLGWAYRPSVDALQLPSQHGRLRPVTRRLVRAAHRRNVAVHVWTVNEEGEMRSFLDLGVDGIVTDRPDVLSRLLHELHGRPLPPGAHGR